MLVAVDQTSLEWVKVASLEQAGHGASGFAGRSESCFTESKLVAVDRAPLVRVKVASLEW